MSFSSSRTLLSLVGEDISYTDFVALKGITLSIAEGEKVALIGQSGAGKTTLLRRLYQLQPELCSFIHQHHALVPQLSVFHNIYIGRLDAHSVFQNLRNLVRPVQRTIDEIMPIAKQLGLEDKLFIRTGELSGGQQQRVGIGRALYRGGSILMADEPVSSLDIVQREEIMECIVEAGKTVVSSLHSINLSQRFFKRIIGLKDKAILFDLPVDLVSDNHIHELYN
ncbi:phosphonate ABC transporter ATP-binding protein [Desulfosediminicola flagellatus]|uniref:phosphonate ABC transporter ATP-binding protein n=1 Tax=Desulfosediminicola flagellatus TaxID=2569541 RepID=UPI0010AC36D8|nr:ATP-binding cassette domain-containing protein [Desulfosediminicola flagellatus]